VASMETSVYAGREGDITDDWQTQLGFSPSHTSTEAADNPQPTVLLSSACFTQLRSG